MSFTIKPPEQIIQETNKIALIDADYIKYIVTYWLFKNHMFNKEEPTPENLLIEEIDQFVHNILLGIECKSKIFIFSGKTRDGFRWSIARDKPYKGNRKSKELLYPNQMNDMNFVFDYIQSKEHTLRYEDLEADDLLAMLQSEDTFIYSKDKDMLQIPGTHFDIKTDEFHVVSEDQGWRFLMAQVLTGDSTDNILGLRNFGPAKVKALFIGVATHELYEVVLRTFIEHLGMRHGVDAFVENYSLVRLTLNRGDWNREKYKDAYNLINTLKLIK